MSEITIRLPRDLAEILVDPEVPLGLHASILSQLHDLLLDALEKSE